MSRYSGRISLVTTMAVMSFATTAAPQNVPWDVFDDPSSESVCDVVNAANAELVVLSTTGELVIVTGSDVILAETFVDADANVFFAGGAAGLLTFATDADGFETLWWVGLNGNVVNVDEFTGEPTVTALRPDDFGDVLCDACALWDDPSVCVTPPVDDDDPPPLININFCGTNAGMSMALTAIGLSFMGRTRKRMHQYRIS